MKPITAAQSIEHWNLDRLKPYDRNARTHSTEQIAQIVASIQEFGFTNPILVDENDGIIAGHGRLMAARDLQMQTVPVVVLSHLSPAQRRAYILADNKLALNAGWDDTLLAAELESLSEIDFDISLLGWSNDELAELLPDVEEFVGDDSEENIEDEAAPVKLADRFGIAPFTILNAREGWWQDRKRQWLSLGIQSEVGRKGNLLGMSETMLEPDEKTRELNQLMRDAGTMVGSIHLLPNYYDKKKAGLSDDQIVEEYLASGSKQAGTSIFDPVLAELAYRWFSAEDATVLDPFAGGSVRGIIASKIGRQYVGHELRLEQVEANREQANEICSEDKLTPTWVHGDSRNIDKTCADVKADFIFSCPPYADLEVYSDDPKDLSTLPYEEFIASYREIIAKSCALLKPDRFACFVVGDVRDKKGNYYNFVGDTIKAFTDAGLSYYNEAILVTPVGTLPMRAGRAFATTRKLGKTHQNVLVFVKGSGKAAATACGECEFADVNEPAVETTEYGDKLTADSLGGEL